MSDVKIKSRAFGLRIEEIDIVVVDDNPGMLKILMTILSAFKVKRARYYTSAEQALTEMIAEPPHIVITDWLMDPINGLDMLQTMRNKAMHPLCNAAIIVLTGDPCRKNMASAIENAATFFMVKPISPQVLMERLKWVCSDDRDYEFEGDQMVIKGQKTEIRSDRRQSPLAQPMLIDYVKAAEEGTEPVLRCAYDEADSKADGSEEGQTGPETEEFVIDDGEFENAPAGQEENARSFQKKIGEDQEDVDWLDSNFSWAF